MQGQDEDEIDDYGDVEKLVLLISRYHDGIKPTRLQKIALIVSAVLKGEVPKNFGAYFFGGFSDDVEEAANILVEEGYLTYVKGKGYLITSDGELLANKVSSKYPEKDKKIREIVNSLKDLEDREIVALTYSLFPELTKKSVIKDTPYIQKTRNVYSIQIKKDQLKELLKKSKKEVANDAT